MQTLLDVEFDGMSWHINSCLKNGGVNLQEVRAVWWRKPLPSIISPILSKDEQGFARRETREAMEGIWFLLDCYWMSHPALIQQASNKLEQLHRANQIGFQVPKTLVTNNPEKVKAFFKDRSEKVVYKTLSSPNMKYSKNKQGREELVSSLVSIENPLQQFIVPNARLQ